MTFTQRRGNQSQACWPLNLVGAVHMHMVLPPFHLTALVPSGGPAYRIGMGGGAASSMVQGENKAELDFNAVQRGDAEMEQKVCPYFQQEKG
eukprot:SAG31_NODE_597_length_13674_cov_3.402947_2_plen_92_part_00